VSRRLAPAQPAFLPSGADITAPGRRGRAVLLCGFLACTTAIVVAAVVVKPTTAHAFRLVYGSVFIDDNVSPVAIDLASGKPTVRLSNAVAAVSAASSGDLQMTPAGQSTLMLNTASGEFNMLDASGLLLKPSGGGVRLPASPGGTDQTVTGVASGSSAYIIRSSSSGTQVYLVDAATVATAAGPRASTVPRASLSFTRPLSAGPASAVSANGALWLLSRGGTGLALQELRVPPASSAGATLTSAARGVVSGPAALESIGADTGASTVALATSRSVSVYFPDGKTATIPFASPPGTDRVLAATNVSGRFAFLVHATNGWNLVTGGLHDVAGRVHPLGGLPAQASLVTPAASGANLYLLRADGNGALWTLSFSGVLGQVPGVTTYPLLQGEKLDLSGAQVLAEGARVIVNARANFESEVIFTDGSHAPLTVDKHSAVQLDPSSTQALVVGHQAGGAKAPSSPGSQKPPKSKPVAAPTVNNRVDCKTSDQTPHIPLVRVVQRASRSVQLSWTYPLLDTQDCVPSTYTVSITALDSTAPRAPGTAIVQGQSGVNLVGLFPDTAYRIVVTAYLNARGTASIPLDVRTNVEGPAAPTEVSSTVDNAGNWQLRWQSCGGVDQGCVPSTTWQITPSFCDGVGLSTPPQPLVVIGDPTSHTFTATYPGTADLLGRGLSFQVSGVGVTGVVGATGAAPGCQYSWSPPRATAITLDASAPPPAAEQDTTTTTVTAHFADGQSADLGGVGGTLTYQLLSGGVVVDSRGPTSLDTVTFDGLRPGVHYQVRASATPNHHPEAAIVIGPVDVQPAIALWPQPSVTATFADTSAATGTLTVTVSLPAGTDSRGETFDLSGATLDCGNSHLDLTQANFAAGKALTFDVARTIYNSASAPCTVTAALAQDAATALAPPLYGAGASAPATSSPISIDAPILDTTAQDFTASWVDGTPPGKPQIAVTYTGTNSTLADFAHDWTLTARTDSAGDCGSTTASPAGAPATIDVDHKCVSSGAVWHVSISFSYFGQDGKYVIAIGGSKPVPVDPGQMTFAAVWTSTSTIDDAHVQLEYSGPYDDTTLDALQWTETVTSSLNSGVTCGSSSGYPQSEGHGPNIAVDLSACPPTTGLLVATYTLHIDFTDPNYGTTGSFDVTVSGAAPQ